MWYELWNIIEFVCIVAQQSDKQITLIKLGKIINVIQIQPNSSPCLAAEPTSSSF